MKRSVVSHQGTAWCRSRWSSHGMSVSNAYKPCSLVPGTAWARVSQFLWGRSVSSPIIYRSSASAEVVACLSGFAR
jgi:hypothetical protein